MGLHRQTDVGVLGPRECRQTDVGVLGPWECTDRPTMLRVLGTVLKTGSSFEREVGEGGGKRCGGARYETWTMQMCRSQR